MKRFDGITVQKKCPHAFSWRGVNYKLSSMDEKTAKRLAEDQSFPWITLKKKQEKPEDDSSKVD